MSRQFILADVFTYLMVFVRLVAAISLMPGFGEKQVFSNLKILITVVLTFIITPLVAETLPRGMPDHILNQAISLGIELFIGAIIGLIIRMFFLLLDIAGTLISMQSGLTMARTFNPISATQGTLAGALLMMVALVLVFSLNMHHKFIITLLESYEQFPAGQIPPLDDLSKAALMLISTGFKLAVQLSAPFIIISVVYLFSLGLISRLVPQMQIFFIAIPLQLLFGFVILALVLSGTMLLFFDYFDSSLNLLKPKGDLTNG